MVGHPSLDSEWRRRKMVCIACALVLISLLKFSGTENFNRSQYTTQSSQRNSRNQYELLRELIFI